MTFEAHAAARLVLDSGDLTEAWARRVADAAGGREHGAQQLHFAAHMPAVLREVANFVVDDDYRLTEQPVVSEALGTLARLRRTAGRTPAGLMQEFDLLAQVLDGACLEWLASLQDPPPPDAVVRVSGRLNRAPILMGAVTMDAYWQEEDAELQRSTQRVREFADHLAHELNTPLNAASLAAQMLEQGNGAQAGEVKRHAALVRRNIDRAIAVLRNVRSASLSIEEQAEPAPLPFGQVLAAVLSELHDELTAAGVHLEFDEPIPGHRVDAAAVRLVLAHLIRNAIAFRDPGKRAWVRLSFREQPAEDGWCVQVRDNGLGIPSEHADHVFHRVFRAHPEQAPGAGVGLTVVAREVERLGGRVEFSTEPGVGSTFRVFVPAAKV
jgi:signal transduction histidine kinase